MAAGRAFATNMFNRTFARDVHRQTEVLGMFCCVSNTANYVAHFELVLSYYTLMHFLDNELWPPL